jgi:hypothetical protein
MAMHVVIYAHYMPPAPSASATRMLSLARYLQKTGDKVTLLTGLAGQASVDGTYIARVQGRWGLFKYLATHRPDVLMVSSPPGTPTAEVALVAKALRIPVLVDVRDPYVSEALANGDLAKGPATLVKGGLERAMLRVADRHSFVSEALRDRMQVLTGQTFPDAVIAPNGADLSQIYPDAAAGHALRERLAIGDAPLFVYQGILGGKLLDRAMAALLPALQNGAHLAIAGIVDAYSEGVFRELRQVLPAEIEDTRVHWLNNLETPALNGLLNAADIGVNPLPLERAYCLPVKTYEYLACGCYNLAHAGPASALAAQLREADGRVVANWDQFRDEAVSLAANIGEVRAGRAARAAHAAVAYAREGANARLAQGLRGLAGSAAR